MATTKSSGRNRGPHLSTEREPEERQICACYDGLVYIGCLVEDPESGEEVEAFEAAPCRRCREAATDDAGVEH